MFNNKLTTEIEILTETIETRTNEFNVSGRRTIINTSHTIESDEEKRQDSYKKYQLIEPYLRYSYNSMILQEIKTFQLGH